MNPVPINETGARRRRPAHGILFFILLAGTLGALGHVAIHLKQLEVGLALGEARRHRADLMEQRRRLKLEIGVLKDPKRILAIAHEKIGLRSPQTDDIVALENLGEPKPEPVRLPKSKKKGRGSQHGGGR